MKSFEKLTTFEKSATLTFMNRLKNIKLDISKIILKPVENHISFTSHVSNRFTVSVIRKG